MRNDAARIEDAIKDSSRTHALHGLLSIAITAHPGFQQLSLSNSDIRNAGKPLKFFVACDRACV